MPILPVAPNCVQVDLIGANQGHTWQNRLHFQGEADIAGADSSDLSTFCDSIAAAWTTNVAPLCNPLVSLTDVNAIILTDRESPTFYAHDSTPPVGSNTGTPLPASAAVCFSWHINRRYRGGHGRIYVPAGNVDDIVNGSELAGAFQIQCDSAVAAFHTQLQGLTLNSVAMQLIVLSYYHSIEDPAHPGETPPRMITVLRTSPLPQLVTSAKVRTRFDTQRRRLGKETR